MPKQIGREFSHQLTTQSEIESLFVVTDLSQPGKTTPCRMGCFHSGYCSPYLP